MDNTSDVILTGAAAGDNFGYAVSNAGDVNNDGYDDVIVGATGNDAGGNNSGRAYLYFGGQNMDSNADVIFTGAAANDGLGSSVSCAGDVNKDGYNDVIVGVPGLDANENNSGGAYLYFGGQNMNNNADITFNGITSNDLFGYSVSNAGDVNNDSYDDIIIGAPRNLSKLMVSHAYVFFGGQNMDNISDVILIGETAGDMFGASVSCAGDVNNDSYDDLIIGAFYNAIGGTNAGRVYIYFGGQNMDNISDLTITGKSTGTMGDILGWSVSNAGDMNNDGYDDVITGAWGRHDVIPGPNVALVYFGNKSMDNIVDLSLTKDQLYDPSNHYAQFVSNAGDVNNDGYNDVIVSDHTGTGNTAGRAYIYSFNNTNISGLLDPNVRIGSKTIWNITGIFNGTAATSDFSQALNDYLRNANPNGTDEFGNSMVDIQCDISAKSGGTFSLFNLTITYQYNATITNFASAINGYLISHQDKKDASGNITVPIKVRSQSAGRVKLFDLNITQDMPPTLIQQIKAVEMDEDTSAIRLIDLYQYFRDDGDGNTNLTFSIVNATNSSFVRLFLTTGRYVSADALSGRANDNWTGTVEAAVACADRWGQKTESNRFTIVVKNVNDPPVIMSSPGLKVEPGSPYYYNVSAIDGDNDVLSFSLAKAPANMTIDSKSGMLAWPRPSKGSFQVNVHVDDGHNGTAEQIFFLGVANTGPTITSTAPPSASTGYRYVYNVTAEDSDNDKLTFSLETSIIGMTIDASNGTITWTPEFPGSFSGTVYVSDGELKARQDFTITVTKGNSVPVFVSKPVMTATVGVPYEYYAKASDGDGDALEFFIETGPAGMMVGGAGGTVSWTPVAAGNFPVVLKVTDAKGAEALQEFTIVVSDRVKAKLEISAPSEGQKVRGKVLVSGTAGKGSLEVLGIQVRLDGGPWANATGTDNWRYSLDTVKLKNGGHSLQARAFDGMDYSDPVNRTITVDNPKAAGKGFIPGLEASMMVIAMAAILIIGNKKRR